MTNPGSGKCPVAFALDIIGDRWSLLIIRDMLFRGKSRYGEFAKSSEKIATNILSNRLIRLEDAGIVTRIPDGKRHAYRLTARGADLIPVILELIIWSARHDPQPNGRENILHGAPPDLLERAENDRDALVAEPRASLAPGAPCPNH